MGMMNTRSPLALVGAAVVMFLTCTSLYASSVDDRIEASALQSHMFRTYLSGDKIRIESREGVVTLTGTVTEASHKALARDTVAALPGVVRVDDRLDLSTARVAWNSDAWLSARVKTALLFHRNVSARNTEITAEDGMIILRGEAASLAQRDLTTQYTDDIEGVDGVRNNMTVSKTLATPSQRETPGRIIDDASITAQVRTALLFRRSTSTAEIQIKTREGVVTLSGTALRASHKALIDKLVNDIDGVRSVVNNITIESALSKND
jgi:osmotically-inducible protein OsmY